MYETQFLCYLSMLVGQINFDRLKLGQINFDRLKLGQINFDRLKLGQINFDMLKLFDTIHFFIRLRMLQRETAPHRGLGQCLGREGRCCLQ